MRLTIDDDVITLKIPPNMAKYQILQLRYFKFDFIDDTCKKKSFDLVVDVQKLLSYFEEEGVEVELGPRAESLLSDINQTKSDARNLFEKAKKIKDGSLDTFDLTSFISFLNSLPRKLKPHQVKAALHLYTIRNGANFSVPGSGKTSVVLAVYEKLRIENKVNMLFVVGPPASFQPWQDEFKATLDRDPITVLLSGGNKESRKSQYYVPNQNRGELYLSTFHTILNDSNDVIELFTNNLANVFFVVDEAHYMKRLDGAWANSLLEIAKHTKNRCILTGTPIPKSYTDLFNLFDFLWQTESPLNENDKAKIVSWEKQNENESARSLLHEKIGPLFYRVRKKDLNLKPAIFHKPFVIDMNPYEFRIYDLIRSRIFELSREEYIENEVVLHKLWKGRMMRLRQAASYPKLLLHAIEEYSEDLLASNSEIIEIIQNYDLLETNGKLEVLTNHVLAFQEKGEKVLIWTNFVGTLHLIKEHFLRLGLRCALIYGQTPTKRMFSAAQNKELTREEIRNIFVDPSSGLNILIANPAALAESVSLHKTCFHAIYYDLSYNAAQYLQSLDRIHRVGGSETNPANYYFLQYEHSIDQDIKNNLEQKAQKMYALIEKDYEIYDLDMSEEHESDIAAYKRLFHTS